MTNDSEALQENVGVDNSSLILFPQCKIYNNQIESVHKQFLLESALRDWNGRHTVYFPISSDFS